MLFTDAGLEAKLASWKVSPQVSQQKANLGHQATHPVLLLLIARRVAARYHPINRRREMILGSLRAALPIALCLVNSLPIGIDHRAAEEFDLVDCAVKHASV